MATKYTAHRSGLTITTIVTGTWRENCYVVSDDATGAALVFDPGDDAEDVLATVTELQLRVERILLTHAHFDHLGAAARVAVAAGVPCEVHAPDLALLRRAPLYAMSFEKRSIELPDHVESFEEGARFRLGASSFEVVATPGHTPGSVCFVGDGFVVSGDTLLREAIGRTDLPGGDKAALVGSIEKLVSTLPGDATLFAGHGRPWSVAEARDWWRAVAGKAVPSGPPCGGGGS